MCFYSRNVIPTAESLVPLYEQFNCPLNAKTPTWIEQVLWDLWLKTWVESSGEVVEEEPVEEEPIDLYTKMWKITYLSNIAMQKIEVLQDSFFSNILIKDNCIYSCKNINIRWCFDYGLMKINIVISRPFPSFVSKVVSLHTFENRFL